MAENFSAYTETDPNSRIAVTSTRVTSALVNRDEDAYVYADKGVGYFSGDFTHYLTYRMTGGAYSGTSCVACWALANLVDDWNGIDVANGDFLGAFPSTGLSAGGDYLRLVECDGGTLHASGVYYITRDTDYYLKVVRDESVGTYGTLYLYIYSNSARTTLLATLSVTLNTSKKDFRYIYALQSADTNQVSVTHSGYTEDLTLINAPAGYIASYPTEAITRVTNLIHRYNRKEGDYSLELALGEVTSDFGLPEWLSRPQASTPEQEKKEVAKSPEVKETIQKVIEEEIRKATVTPPEPSEAGIAGPGVTPRVGFDPGKVTTPPPWEVFPEPGAPLPEEPARRAPATLGGAIVGGISGIPGIEEYRAKKLAEEQAAKAATVAKKKITEAERKARLLGKSPGI